VRVHLNCEKEVPSQRRSGEYGAKRRLLSAQKKVTLRKTKSYNYNRMNIKNAGYNFRAGYTFGFNEGLTGKVNKHKLPGNQWNSAEKLDLERMRNLPDIKELYLQDSENGEIHEYYKIGYNWGHLQGREVREPLKDEISEQAFEKCMDEFANCMRILYLQINRERYLAGVIFIEPESEKNRRIKFMNHFVMNTGGNKPDKTILQDIKTLLSENKVQQALDKSLTYFRDQKDLSHFNAVLTLKSNLMALREASKNLKIEKADYLIEKWCLGKSLSGMIDAELLYFL
jgi:hypothetical protein